MSNGPNEPIQFTRDDAKRLAVVERDICHVKKGVNKMLKIMYGTGVSVALLIIKEIYFKVNGG